VTNFEKWDYYLKDLESPQIFLDYTWLCTIASTLQRRVAISGVPSSHDEAQIYPNLYVIFIGPPSVGKTSAAREAKRLMSLLDTSKEGKTVQLIKRAPDSTTLEALTRFLHTHYSTLEVPPEYANGVKGKIYTHSSLAFFCGDELGTLIKENTNDLVVFLNQGWDCGDFHRETKTQGVDFVKNMCITLLGAATPEWIKHSVSSRLLGEGFTARTLFIYGAKKRKLVYRIQRNEDQRKAYTELKDWIKEVAKLFGEVKIPPHVDDWLNNWYHTIWPNRVNNDKKLDHYYGRKKIHLLKLAMAYHFSEKLTMELDIEDCERALKMLDMTELDMDKALAGAGRNALNGVAVDIVNFLENSATKSALQKRIIVEFFGDATVDEIMQVLEFLVNTGRVVAEPKPSGLYYTLVEKPPEHKTIIET
jgi:hypothetical protein